jgi:tRNA dimethylallyltransferase
MQTVMLLRYVMAKPANRPGPVIFIVGPTAVGKTRVSLRLAKRLGAEIISCDSMQVYKGMPVLSQAPSAGERKKIRHHLVGCLDPRREYSVAVFRKTASSLIKSIIKRKKMPIVVGGSGLYVKALIDGLFPSPQADMGFRRSMQAFASRYGSKRLHAKLIKIDPATAAAIHPNDIRRVIRALEVHRSTGRTMTELKSRTKGLKDHYDIRIFGLDKPREKLYRDIDARVDRMFELGLMREVKRLKTKRLSKTAGAALGIKEVSGYLEGECDLAAAVSLLKMNTRRFAKRQLTWFRADRRIKWFDVCKTSEEAVIKKIEREIWNARSS